MSDICFTCGGYIDDGYLIRRLPAVNSEGVPYPEAEVPPVKICKCNKGLARHFFIGEADLNHYASDVPWSEPALTPEQVAAWPFTSELDLRRFIADEVARQLPDAIRKAVEEDAREIQQNPAFQPTSISVHEHRRVEMFEESGKQWRGMLYRVEAMPSEQVPPGMCWACGEQGKAEEMMWHERGGRSHLIHATEECIRAAEIKPETREHRG